MTARRLLRLWFGLSEPVSRGAYALSGFGLMTLKYATETGLVHHVTGRWLTPLDYGSPFLTSRLSAVGGSDLLTAALIAWTLPFLWIGVSMTMRRAEDAGRSPFLALLYFVPLVNYATMLILCVLPSRPRPGDRLSALEAQRSRAPHLDGYLRVRGGEFRLRPLADGRTLLEGRTFYEMRIFPAAYWRLWSDVLIHAIHQRVLGHIKALSEAGLS